MAAGRSSGGARAPEAAFPGQPLRLGVSSCLLGHPLRYDGGHKLDPDLRDVLGRFVAWVPVCPEVDCGLPVPREALELRGDPAAPRLVTRVTGVDHTPRMLAWARRRLAGLARADLCGFVFKSRSPSCALREVQVRGAAGSRAACGPGIFVRAFIERLPGLPVEDELGLRDPRRRESFLELVLALARRRELPPRSRA